MDANEPWVVVPAAARTDRRSAESPSADPEDPATPTTLAAYALEAPGGDRIGAIEVAWDTRQDVGDDLLGYLERCSRLVTQLLDLEEEVSEYGRFVDLVPEPVVILDLDGAIEEINPAFLKLMGAQDEHSLVGRSFLELVERGDRARVTAELARALFMKRRRGRIELQLAVPGRGAVPCSVSAGHLRGLRRHLQLVVHDLSERLRVEDERSHLSEQLARAQRLDAVGQLAGGLAHDLNNLLVVMLSNLSLARESLEAALSDGGGASLEEVREDLGELQVAVDRAEGLTSKLLQFARQEEDAKGEANVVDVVAAAARLVERSLGDDIDLEFFIDGGVPAAAVDPVHLERVIVNLLINARDAIDAPGSICIEVDAPEDGSSVRVAVRDDGRGMDDATRAREDAEGGGLPGEGGRFRGGGPGTAARGGGRRADHRACASWDAGDAPDRGGPEVPPRRAAVGRCPHRPVHESPSDPCPGQALQPRPPHPHGRGSGPHPVITHRAAQHRGTVDLAGTWCEVSSATRGAVEGLMIGSRRGGRRLATVAGIPARAGQPTRGVRDHETVSRPGGVRTRGATMISSDAPLHLAPEVADALADGRPVVALESTILAHGLPRPRNLEVGAALEAQLRDAGVAPATIAVLDGTIHVGLSSAQLEHVAMAEDVAKASVRDLPVVAATHRDAATTVASTAYVAALAGIRVFATGGLGGVHRDAMHSFDESADLQTLGRTPIVVVSAGVKSILDVPATLERLETLGVSVVGYRTDRFPGFYVTDSGEPVDWRVEDADEVAAMLAAADALGISGAIAVANPLPEDQQLDPDLHRRALSEALAAAEAQGLRGKQVTPFLLDHIQQATGGASLEANIRAVTSNVRLAADIAHAVAAAARAAS
jgi:pseudouridylate synthase